MIKLFWATLSFLSRLPVPDRWSQGLEIDRYVRGIVTFPLVGALLGGLSGLVFLAVQSWCGLPLAALFSILALALLTGGFHLDGLADTCDGVFSARRRERMLEIMRDSRLGTHGGLALIFVLLAKVLVVSELALRGTSVLAALAAACAAGRGVCVLLMYRHRYAREEGLGNIFIGKVNGRQTCVTLGLAAILAAILLPGMHGVACSVDELALKLVPEGVGGVMSTEGPFVEYVTGNVAPGVFVIAKSTNDVVTHELDYLKLGKGPYYALYRPYHLASIEANLSIGEAIISIPSGAMSMRWAKITASGTGLPERLSMSVTATTTPLPCLISFWTSRNS